MDRSRSAGDPIPLTPPGLNKLLDHFDESWRRGTPPRIADIMSALPAAAADAARGELLAELVAIDLEYRWRGTPAESSPGADIPARPLLEDYVQRYPALGPWERVSVELITAEYRVRRRWGDRPGHAEYATRFAYHGVQLRQALLHIDAELLDEFGRVSGVSPSQGAAASIVSVAALQDALCRYGLLNAAQLDDLSTNQSARGVDARVLARTLLERDWLTPYQVNQLLQGRGADLVLGPYLILERLGEGGTGQVFKARHQRLHRVVALKVIRRELLADTEVMRRFNREIQVVGQLDHPNVVRAYDAGPIDSTYVLAMEYVEGIDLARLVKRSGPLPVALACDYIRQAALGLQHAHERGLVHRDIKPANMLVAGGGWWVVGEETSERSGPATRHSPPATIKILDLGLARLQKEGDKETTSLVTPQGSSVMGTPDYLAPEQAVNFHGADIRADIYSLGCTFYYLLTGQPPFPGGMLAEKLLRHQQAKPPAVEKLRSGLPRGLPRVLARMLAKRPEDRFQTPAAVAEALAALNGQGWPAPVNRRNVIAAACLLALGMLATVGWWAFRQPPHGYNRPVERSAWTLDQLDGGAIAAEERSSSRVNLLVAVWGNPPWRHWGPVTTLAFSPDGQQLASAGRDPTIRLWHPETGLLQATLGTDATLLHRIAFAADGRTLASLPTYGRAVQLWDLRKRAVRLSLAGHASTITCVAFSRDGKTVATGSRDNTVKLWDSATGKELATLPGHAGAVTAVAFGPGDQRLASASEDKTIKLWNPASKREQATLKGHAGVVTAVAFSPGGKLLASGSDDKTVLLWDAVQGKEQAALKAHTGPVRSLAFAADGTTLASGGDDATVILWDPVKGTRGLTLEGHHGKVNCVAFAPKGSLLASAADDETVKLWDTATGKEKPGPLGRAVPIPCLAFSPDGRMLALGQDRVVQRWDLAGGTTLAPLQGHQGKIRCLAFAPDGATLATGSEDRTLKLWDPRTGTLAGSLEGHAGPVNTVAFTRDAKTLASGSDDRTLKLWDLTRGKERTTLKGHLHPILSLAFAPDGRTLASGCWKAVKVWNIDDGTEQFSQASEAKVHNVAFSADGRVLAFNTRLWNLVDRREADNSPARRSPEFGLTVFDPHSQALIGGRHLGHLDRWEPASAKWQSVCTLPGDAQALALAPDGRHLAVANSNGTVFLLRLSNPSAIAGK